MVDSFLTVLRLSRKERCIEICAVLQESRPEMLIYLFFLKWPLQASVMERLKANGASPMSDFHRASLEMAWLPLCRITNESTETENWYYSLNRELRWLWNSVYKTNFFKLGYDNNNNHVLYRPTTTLKKNLYFHTILIV